jgi:hypothetical protein
VDRRILAIKTIPVIWEFADALQRRSVLIVCLIQKPFKETEIVDSLLCKDTGHVCAPPFLRKYNHPD